MSERLHPRKRWVLWGVIALFTGAGLTSLNYLVYYRSTNHLIALVDGYIHIGTATLPPGPGRGGWHIRPNATTEFTMIWWWMPNYGKKWVQVPLWMPASVLFLLAARSQWITLPNRTIRGAVALLLALGWTIIVLFASAHMISLGIYRGDDLPEEVQELFFAIGLVLTVSIVKPLYALLSPRSSEAAEANCATCGYDLHGNVSDRCPECGTPFSLVATDLDEGNVDVIE